MIDFKGKTVLVTGGGAGIGRGIAEAFGAAGARVVVAEVKPELVEETRQALIQQDADSLVVQADVTREADVQALAQAIEHKYGGLDVLINNVGDFLLAKRFEEFDEVLAYLYKARPEADFDLVWDWIKIPPRPETTPPHPQKAELKR